MIWKSFFVCSCIAITISSAHFGRNNDVNDCPFIVVSGSNSRNVTGTYLRSNATRSRFDDPVWKLPGRDRYIFKKGVTSFAPWAIGTASDKRWNFADDYIYKGNSSLPLTSKRWKSKTGQSVSVQCHRNIATCCNTLRTVYKHTRISAQIEKYGHYNFNSTLINGRPHYTSDMDNGAYAIWYVNQRWMVGPTNQLGRELGYLFIDDRNQTMCPDQVAPRYSWFYHDYNKNWAPAHQNFYLSCQ